MPLQAVQQINAKLDADNADLHEKLHVAHQQLEAHKSAARDSAHSMAAMDKQLLVCSVSCIEPPSYLCLLS